MRNRLSWSTKYITNDSILGGVNYEHNINPETDLIVGTSAAAKIVFEYIPETANHVLTENTNIQYSINQSHDGAVWRTIGYFNVTGIEKTGQDRYRITAYDNVSKFDKDIREYLYAEGRFPITVGNLLAGICSECGVTLQSSTFTNSTLSIPTLPFGGNTINARQIVSFIAAVAGGFIYARPDGKIEVKHFASNYSRTLYADNYKTVTFADDDVPTINNIRVAMGDSEVGITYPETMVSGEILDIPYNGIFYNNGDIETVRDCLEEIYDTVHTYSYRPCSLEMFEDYSINVGDKIIVYWTDHRTGVLNWFYTYIFNKTISASGVTLNSTGNQHRDTTANMVDSEIQQLVGKYHTIENTVDKHRQVLGDLATGNIKSFQIDATNGVSITDEVTQQTVFIDGASIKADRIDAGDINMTGRITWNDINSSAKEHMSGNIYRQATVPVGTTEVPLVTGAFWYCTAAIGTTYAANTWYTYDGTNWNLTDSPYYIKSTYIDSIEIKSPTISGGTIKTLGGKFQVKDSNDAVQYGYMGMGYDIDASGTGHSGVILSASDDATLTSNDAYVLATTNGIRISFGDYSIVVKNDGAWYEDSDTGITTKLGVARFS